MKILCLIPPYIPSYFNAGHHLPVFLVGAYLRLHLPKDNIECKDCAALNVTWKEICDFLAQKYDVIVLLNDFDAIDTFERLVYYRDNISPNTKIITFGRLSKQIPRSFFQYKIDAVHWNGDYEPSILKYILYLKGEVDQVPGVLLSNDGQKTIGEVLKSEEWVLPEVKEIPYDAYSHMYHNDFNKFCGIPQRQELVVPVARGCPVGCDYCDVPLMQGRLERRLSVEKTIEYIKESFESLPFEYVSFYAPTFTLNQKWVKDFCNAMQNEEKLYPWKCVTVLKMLNGALIKQMQASGCVRISLGIESFTNTARMSLPKVKQDTLSRFKEVSALCKKHGIELNCFIILGLPGDRPEDVQATIDICLREGARVRPTIYTPYHHLHEEVSISDVRQYNRQIFPEDFLSDEIAQRYYNIFYANKLDRSTQVMRNIPKISLGMKKERIAI